MAALSVMVMAAVSGPALVGVKCPWTMQLAPAARLAPQLFAKTKEEASVPVTAMLAMDSGAPPGLDIVTDCDALVVPTDCAAKERLMLDRDSAGAVPVPVRLTICSVVTLLSKTSSDAGREPAAAGLKVTEMLQLAPAAKVAPQVVVLVYEDAPVPAIAIFEIVSKAAPVFFSVTTLAAVATPT